MKYKIIAEKNQWKMLAQFNGLYAFIRGSLKLGRGVTTTIILSKSDQHSLLEKHVGSLFLKVKNGNICFDGISISCKNRGNLYAQYFIELFIELCKNLDQSEIKTTKQRKPIMIYLLQKLDFSPITKSSRFKFYLYKNLNKKNIAVYFTDTIIKDQFKNSNIYLHQNYKVLNKEKPQGIAGYWNTSYNLNKPEVSGKNLNDSIEFHQNKDELKRFFNLL